MRRLLCVLCGLFLGLGPAIAQSPDFKSFDLGNSKDIPQVLSIAQDDINHLYFGTKKGLYHYNGVEFQLVQLNDSVNEVEITALTNANGHIWVGTSEGLVFQVNQSSAIVNDRITNALDARVNSIAVLGDMMAIATYGQGIFIVRPDTLIQIQVEDGLPDDYTYDVIFHDNRLWVGTDGGIAELDLVSLACVVHSMRNGLPDNIVQSLAVWDDHTIAVGMYDYGVSFLDTRSYEFRIEFNAEHPWQHGVIEDMCCSKDGLLWVATKDAGVITLSESVNGLNWRSYSEINGITSNRTNAVFADAEHNVWIGTRKGLTLYKGSGIEYLLSNEGVIGLNIYDVLVDQARNLWLASEAGVVKYSHNQTGAEIIELILQNDKDKSLQIVSLFEASDGTIYMGSLGSGLFTYQGERGIEKIGEKEGLFNPNVMDIAEDLKGRIWLATLGDGVFKLEGGRAVQIEETKGLASNYIYCLSIDDEQRLWIGSDGGGVGIYDCHEGYWIPSMVEELSDATVYSITHAGNGDVWFATEKKGLFRLDEGILSQVGEEMGLRSSEILGLESSYSGGIVAMHGLGLDYLALGSKSFKPFTIEKEGFSFEPNLNALHAMHGDEVWVGSINGAVKVKLDQERHESLTPNVSITNLRVQYEPRELIPKYDYNFSESHFIFDFLAIWMKDPDMIRYQYMLEGFDKQWSFETEGRVATYSSLPPGHYTFYVRASNENGDGLYPPILRTPSLF
ncbi:MAG: hypothetical protein HQ500_05445 [Flavobacteriales bacterium]|nr:hypothetical protein [Flavobacteriales bacterium]